MMTSKRIVHFVILIFVLITSGCSRNTSCDLVAMGIEGIVLEKNYSPNNHGARGIVIRSNSKRDEGFGLGDVDVDFYNIIEVGDSLYKREHSRDVMIFRGNREIEAELQCGLK